MSINGIFLTLAALAVTVVLAGCMTPESRIRRHPEIVARIDPARLELIKQGRVEPGFDMELVRLAVGEPDHVSIRMTGDVGNEVWGYANYEDSEGQPLYRGLYHFYYLSDDPDFPYYLNFPKRRVRDRFRVVFLNDQVIAVETEDPGPKPH